MEIFDQTLNCITQYSLSFLDH